MYTCVYMYIYTYIYICVYIYTQSLICWALMPLFVNPSLTRRLSASGCLHIYTCIYINVYTYIIYIYKYIYVYARIHEIEYFLGTDASTGAKLLEHKAFSKCVCAYVYIYTCTHAHTHIATPTHTHKYI